MNYTQHYQLPQWVETDRIMMDDFNDMTAKLDSSLAAAAQGNCRIVTGSYVGTGTYGAEHPNSLTFDFQPRIVFLGTNLVDDYNSVPEYYLLFRSAAHFVARNTSSKNTLTWGEKTVSWYYPGSVSESNQDVKQFNESGVTYHYIAIG